MIASLTYEDYCDLSDGTTEPLDEAEMRADSDVSGHELMGGWHMEEVEQRLGDGDGDELSGSEPWWFEELDDSVSVMTEAERGELAAYALASCSPDHGLVSVLAWICKSDAAVWRTLAAEAVTLLSNQLAAQASDETYVALCEVLERVSPDVRLAALQTVEAE